MKKTYGVYAGLLAMGLAVLGAPVSKAANDAGTATDTTAVSTPAAPAAASPADMDRRIEALEMELAEMKAALAAKKSADDAAPVATVAQDAGQTTPPAKDTPPAVPEKTTIATLLGPTSISGFLDTYYQVNFNHPSSFDGFPGADFRFSDFRDKSISLNMIELILDKAPDATSGVAGRTGYHVSLGFGDGINVTNSFDPAGLGFAQYLKEAYFSYLAPVGSGLQVDVGKFVTPMGAEVIESKDNWNYSRGLLFTYAIPLYHFGARAKYVFNSKYNLTGYVVNGWNNIVDNNSGKTYGFSFNSTPTKTVSYTINYLAGPEESTGAFGLTGPTSVTPVSVNGKWRQTWDAVATYNPTGKFSLMGNFDYGRGDRACISCINGTFPTVLSSPVSWWGFAGYAKYAPDANDYFAARYEYYDDPNGFTGTSSIPSGNLNFSPIDFIPSNRFNAAGGLKNLHFNEFTATYQRTLASFLLTRFEYRRDMSDFPVYAMSSFEPGVKQQSTASISMIFLFDTRNAK